MASPMTATQKRIRKAKHVGEALAIFREKHRLSYDELQLAMWNAGHEISVRTLKRLILQTHTGHATTLAAVEAFLKNAGAPAAILTNRKRVVVVKPRRGKAWASGSRSERSR